MQILVVEDDAILRGFVVLTLEDAGYEVIDEGSAEAALDLEILSAPSAVVTNVNLGKGISGFDFVKKIRLKWPDVGIVFVSGLPSNFANHPLDENERFLPKPFVPAQLLLAIQEVRACKDAASSESITD
jgi:DNA-binding response OmpR family regulator